MNASLRSAAREGFTLIEIVLVLAIVAVLAGFAVPFLSGILHESAMREPMEELEALAKAVRQRAIQERRAYEIVFTGTDFSAQPLRLYLDPAQDPESPEDPAQENGETVPAPEETALQVEDANGLEATPSPTPQPLPRYAFAPGLNCRVLFWGRSQWIEPGPEDDSAEPGRGRWVFQPTGVCSPVRVRFEQNNGNSWIEAAFNPLTADTQDERHLFPD